MKNCFSFLLVIVLVNSLFVSCSETIQKELSKPRLLITLKTEAGKSVPGASVRLYKNVSDPGLVKISDSSGVVIFSELEPVLYYWLAEKACKTNKLSQMTLDRPLVPGAILYGYSVLAEAGTLKIINNSTDAYKVSDSTFTVTVKKDTPYIVHRKVRSYLIHSEKISTPGTGKDSLIRIRCGDTTIINLPY
jgi:hypothetical protein